MKKAVTWILYASALIPLILARNLVTFAIGGKVTLARGIAFLSIAIIAAIVVFVKAGKANPDKAAITERALLTCKNPLILAMLANIFVLILSTIFAYDKQIAFFGEPFHLEGFLTIFSFVLIAIGMHIVFEKKEWQRYFLYTWLVSFVVFIYEIYQAFKVTDTRPDSLLGNPIYLASYLLFSLFVAGQVFIHARKNGNKFLKYAAPISVVLFVIGILLTDTRGTVLSLAVAGLA